MYASGNTEFDGSFTNQTDFIERVLALRGEIRPTSSWNVSLMVGNSRDDQDSLYDDPLTSDPVIHVGRFDTEKRHATLQSDLSIADDSHILTLGVDYVDDRVDSDTPFDETSRDNPACSASTRRSSAPITRRFRRATTTTNSSAVTARAASAGSGRLLRISR